MDQKKYTIRELRALCQNVGAQHNAQTIFGLANRAVSIYLTKLFIKTSITPNQITVAGTVVYLLGITSFIFGEWETALLGSILLVFAGILDACDGEVARFRKLKGGYGASYVEPASHDIMYGLTFLPIAYGAFIQTGDPYVLLFGAAATIFKLLYRLGEVRYLYGVLKKQQTSPANAEEAPKKFKEQSFVTKILYVAYRHTATSTGLVPPLIVAGLFERLDLYVLVYGVYYGLLWGALFVKQMLRFRRVLRQDAAIPLKPDSA